MVRFGLEFGHSAGAHVIRGQLATALRGAHAVLFDFDGPICSVFAGAPARSIAHDLRKSLETKVGRKVSIKGRNADDPMEILRLAPSLGPGAAEIADDLLTEAETTAISLASPTPGGESSLRECLATGRRVAIVSNNSAAAVRRYLNMRDLADLGVEIVGREYSMPHRMKPNPTPVQVALRQLDVAPAAAILIGDSVSDIQAARAAGVPCVAYANKPDKSSLLANADVVIDDMRILAEHLARVPVVVGE